MDKIKKEKSIHTKLGYYLILIAGITELIIGFRYAFSPDPFDSQFGMISILESIFAFTGLFVSDLIMYRKLRIKPKSDEFKPLNPGNLSIRTIIILFTILIIQMIFQFIPATIREYDMALAIAFAGPSEESLFRGLMMSTFIVIAGSIPTFKIQIPYTKKDLSLIEVSGIILSSVLFMLLHVNYYNNIRLLLSVFFSGIALAFFFWAWEDLTACILAHFLLNIITVGQIFWMVGF